MIRSQFAKIYRGETPGAYWLMVFVCLLFDSGLIYFAVTNTYALLHKPA